MAVHQVSIGYASPGGGSLPVWLAHEAGLFRELGIETDVQLHEVSTVVVARLVDKVVDFANVAAPAVINATLAGNCKVRMITGGVNYLAQMLVVRPEFTKVTDIAGLRFGARTAPKSTRNELDYWLFEQMLPRLGIEAPAREDVVQIGPRHQDAIDGLLAGQIDATLLVPPYAFEAETLGLKILADGFDLQIPYQLGGLAATEETIASNPGLVSNMVRGYMRGIKLFRSSPDLVVDIIQKYTGVTDRDIARATADCFARYFQPVPYPTLTGLQSILDQFTALGRPTQGWSGGDFMDAKFVRRLEESGEFANEAMSNV